MRIRLKNEKDNIKKNQLLNLNHQTVLIETKPIRSPPKPNRYKKPELQPNQTKPFKLLSHSFTVRFGSNRTVANCYLLIV
mgnify:CR=1 FL=1